MLELMQAIAAQIQTAVDADDRYDAFQVYPRLIWNPTPPTIDIYPGDPSRDPESAAFHDLDGGYLFTIRARVGTPDNEAGQNLLLAMLDDGDPLSIRAALDADPHLGGLGRIGPAGTTGYLFFPAANNEGAWLGAQWTVLVTPAHS
jgi:hypothetical protein